MRNKNSKICIIPPGVEKLLNNPITDTSTVIYDEYEPILRADDIPRIAEKLSTTYSYMFLEDVPDIEYVDNKNRSIY